MDVRWKDGLDRTVGQHARLVRVGCPLDRWTGQDSGASLVNDNGISISNRCPMEVHWTDGQDRTVGPPWSVRLGSSMDSHGHPDQLPTRSIPTKSRM